MKAAIFAAVLALLAVGVWFFRSEQQLQQRSVEETLWSIANLKVGQIAAWRSERIADAEVITSRNALTDSVRKYLSDPTDLERAEILRRLRPILERYHFANILVVDPQKRVRLSLVPGVGLCHANTDAIDKAFAERRPVWTPLHLSPDDAFPHFSLVAPLFSEKEGKNPVGAIVLVSDAAQFLYPLIQFWPVPSETAETLLVRKDGNHVLFLNGLRHRKDTALKFWIPLSRTDLPAAMAIKGVTGIVEGKDYRDVDVIAAILPIPGSPWFMVSKVDTEEAFAEWRFRSMMIAVFVLGGLALVAAAAFVVRQRNLKAHYRALYQSEANLSEALKRHRITLRAIGDAVISTDAEGRVDLMNPVAEALTGWPQIEARGRKLKEVFSIVNEHTREPVDDPVAKVLKEGTVVALANHTLLLARDGSEIPIADSGSPIRDEEGNTIGVVLVFKDQSNERQYEKKILESERKYRLLTDNTLDVIWTMNMDLEFTYVNPAVQALTGHKPEEWVGTRLPDQCDEEAFSHMAKIIGGEVAKGKDHQGVVFETEILRKDNSLIPVEIHGKIIFDEHGHPVGLQGTTRDISERRKAEEVKERLEQQFHQAQKLESVGRLAGGIAHDLNNLLSPIIGYGEMLQEEEIDGSLREEAANAILNAGKRARDLVRQILAFSRKQTLAFTAINLNDLLKKFEKLLRRTVREDVKIHMNLAPSLPAIQGDPGQLEQVIMNLVVNAQDAMPDGGELIIETSQVELDADYAKQHEGAIPGSHVMLVVTDTGTGMDEGTRAHLFEPFFTTKEQGKGTGLGLATVFGIVKQHGGNIWPYSEPGQGTTIKVYLPAALGHIQSVGADPDDSDILSDVSGNEKILLVEDDVQVRKLTLQVLKQKGYEVVPAQGGREALEFLEHQSKTVDLLLTDVVMPDMNGKQLYEKSLRFNPDIKVLYMSGYSNNVIAHRGILDSGIHFIQKPFSNRSLLEKIREVLDQ